MADDGGLELNLVSEPLADLQPKKKKRASGKAWDKKKKRQPTMTTNSTKDSSSSTAKQTQQQGKGGSEGKGQPRPQSNAVNSNSSSSSIQKGSSETAVVPAVASGSPGQHGRSGTEPAGKPTAAATPGARRHGSNATSPNARANKPGTSPRGKKSTTEGGHKDREPPSNERRRVLEMAGRLKTPTPAAAPLSGNDKPSGGLSSSARATKRKRPAAGGGPTATAGPVASGGVIDFTVGDTTSTPNSKKKKRKKDDPKAEAKNRKEAATAAAVAKATAAMAKSGGKWWDDDDDDHVVVAAAKKNKPISTSYYAAGGGFGGWKPGAHNADGEEQGKGVEEDKDGGLPSDVHPNSVRTKAVDMDGEASKAMEILGALLGKDGAGGEGGPREESRRIKNGGKSKKKARETPKEGPLEGGGGASGSLGKTDAAVQRQAMDVESADPAEGEQSRPAGTSPEESGSNADDASLTAEAKSADSGGTEATVALASRKNRARIAAAAAATADAAAGGTIPLPEHHARPRELSRRAAVRPLASARSAHVMAAGPGATFAALNLPPKMVSHLEEPKGDLGGGGMGLTGPTVCQLAAVPVLAAGNNTVIKSETGSGKTLAYLLPMLCDLASVEPRVDREKGTLAIVLAPTRELGSQILEVLAGGATLPPFVQRVRDALTCHPWCSSPASTTL